LFHEVVSPKSGASFTKTAANCKSFCNNFLLGTRPTARLSALNSNQPEGLVAEQSDLGTVMSESGVIHVEHRPTACALLTRRPVATGWPSFPKCCSGFTLIELMAVILVITVLTAIGIQVATYAQRRLTTQQTKAQLAMIESALEAYKADFGYYPRTDAIRISGHGGPEGTNNWYLYRALIAGGKRYLSPSGLQLQLNPNTGINSATSLTNIFDVFGTPYYYYNAPTNAYSLTRITSNCSYTVGGQVNKATFDLFSLGPDRATYIPTLTATDCQLDPWRNWVGVRADWITQQGAIDDITNWTP